MQPTGRDRTFYASNQQLALDICCRAMLRYWPAAQFENALTGVRYPHYCNIPFNGTAPELFIYRDELAAEQDDPANEVYVHLLSGENGAVTVVTGDCLDDAVQQIIGVCAQFRILM